MKPMRQVPLLLIFLLFVKLAPALAEDMMIESPSAFSKSRAHGDSVEEPTAQAKTDAAVERQNSSETFKPPEGTPEEPPALHSPPSNLHPAQGAKGQTLPQAVPADPDVHPQ